MLHIGRGKNNILILTLKERVTLSSPSYLMRLESRASRTVKRFVLPADTSSYDDRFNKFTITETDGTETLTSGVVTLKPTGIWDYDVYEQTSTTNLNEQDSSVKTLLESGQARITSTQDTNTFFNKQTDEIKYYGTGST